MEEILSFVPLLLLMIPSFSSLIVLFFGKNKGFLREGITIVSSILALIVSSILGYKTLFCGGNSIVYTIFYRNIFVDSVSSLMAILVNIIVLVIVIYSLGYTKQLVDSEKIKDSSLRIYYTLILAFNTTMMLTVMSNHLILLYISVEASTLATAFLVGFFKDRRGLEAAYKYIILVVLGIAFALMGCILLYASVVPHITGHDALLLTEIGKVATMIPKNIALLAVACFIIGFGAKGGLLPFHPWLPDAHAEAPTPISALLSGLVIKIGAYAFLRTVTIFAPHYKGIVIFATSLACISMFLGILLAFSQDDIKRLLAFSSISQISYIFCAFALGSFIGIYAGIFHLINHAILKSLLFLSVGAIMYATGSRKISRLHGLSKKLPITSFCFFVGAMGISGMPLFNGFHSKFAIFVALADQGLWWALGISIATSVMTLSVFAWTSYRILWSNSNNNNKTSNQTKEVPIIMWLPMVVLSCLVILIGLYPQLVYPLINSATLVILDIIKGVTL